MAILLCTVHLDGLAAGTITIKPSTLGTVIADNSTPEAGTTVKLTLTGNQDANYTYKAKKATITVLYDPSIASGRTRTDSEIPLIREEVNYTVDSENENVVVYSFTMPAGDVEVEAWFVAGVSASNVTVNGESVTVDGMVEGTDYTLSWTDSEGNVVTPPLTESGSYTLQVNFIGEHAEELPVSIADAYQVIGSDKVNISVSSAIYTGGDLTPTITVDGLTAGTDYDVVWKNSYGGIVGGGLIDADDYTATITFKGIYGGVVTKSFTIEAKETTDASGNKIVEDENGVMLTDLGTSAVSDGTITVPSEVDGKAVSSLGENIFSSIDKSEIGTIDLSGTSITDINVSRDINSGSIFAGFSENTLIFLPEGTILSNGSETTNVIIGTECTDLLLNGESTVPFFTSKDFTASSVTFRRDFSEYVDGDKMATVFLPFALTADQVSSLGAFYEFDRIENNEVKLTSAVTSTQANKPYIFKPSSAVDEISTSSLEVKALGTGENVGTLKGTYEPIIWTSTMLSALPSSTSIYGYAAETKSIGGKTITPGVFVKVKAGASIAPFRAYLEVTGTAGARLEYSISFDDEATGIRSVKADDNGSWYSIDGRRLSGQPSAKGVYIKNGKKTIIK